MTAVCGSFFPIVMIMHSGFCFIPYLFSAFLVLPRAREQSTSPSLPPTGRAVEIPVDSRHGNNMREGQNILLIWDVNPLNIWERGTVPAVCLPAWLPPRSSLGVCALLGVWIPWKLHNESLFLRAQQSSCVSFAAPQSVFKVHPS